MKTRLIAIAALLFAVSLIPATVDAAQTEDLIKCPDFSSVYYLAEDGKRHVFPNDGFIHLGTQILTMSK